MTSAAYAKSIAQRNGFASYREYRDAEAVRKGFKSRKEYEECLSKMRREGFRGDLRFNPDMKMEAKAPEKVQLPEIPWLTISTDNWVVYTVALKKPRGAAVKWGKVVAFERPVAIEQTKAGVRTAVGR